MNEAQKAELRVTIYGSFGPLAIIFDPRTTSPSVAEHAFSALIELLGNKTRTLESYHSEFSNSQLLESILFMARIIDHPCPQNRANGSAGYYTIYTANNEIIGQCLLRDGIDSENGFVYWHSTNGKRVEQHEKIGLLGLTAKQGRNETPLSKNHLMLELKQLIFEAYNDYLQKRILFLESNKDSESMLPYPQLDFSPEQVTCPITFRVFHTPVILINVNNERSGPIEKEKALALLETTGPCCPITRKPLRGFVICTATKAQADQFWEKYQCGRYTQEFVRFVPKPDTLAKPDCYFLSDRDQRLHLNSNPVPAQNRNPNNNSSRRLLLRHFLQTYTFEPDETSHRPLNADQAAVIDPVAHRNYLNELNQIREQHRAYLLSMRSFFNQTRARIVASTQPTPPTLETAARFLVFALFSLHNQLTAPSISREPRPGIFSQARFSSNNSLRSSPPLQETIARIAALALFSVHEWHRRIGLVGDNGSTSSPIEETQNLESHQPNEDDSDRDDIYGP